MINVASMKSLHIYEVNNDRFCFPSFLYAVNYQVALVDGTIVAKTPKEGIEFYVKDGILS